MSRRYGRNQKRDARQHIAVLDAEIQELTLRYCRAQDARLEAETELRVVAEALGRGYIGLKPRAIAMAARDLEAAKYDRSFKLATPDGPVTMAWLSLDSWKEDPRNQIHIRAILDDHCAGYAVSTSALRDAVPSVLVYRIAKAMAELLVHEIRKHRTPRGNARTAETEVKA